MIQDRIPKSTFVGKEVFELGIFDAVANFNMGNEVEKEVQRKLVVQPGTFYIQALF